MKNTAFKKFTGPFGTLLAIRDDGHRWFATRIGNITKYIPDSRGRAVEIKVMSEKHMWKLLNRSTSPKVPALKRWLMREVIPVL